MIEISLEHEIMIKPPKKNWHLIDTHKGAVISEQCYILSQNYVMQIDYFQHSILFGQPDASISLSQKTRNKF